MPRRREKTRTDYLAEALELHLKEGGALDHIQLRSMSDDLKATVREIRRLHTALSKALVLALQQDVPKSPRVTRPRRS